MSGVPKSPSSRCDECLLQGSKFTYWADMFASARDIDVGPEGLNVVDDAPGYAFPGHIKPPLVSARLASITSIARLSFSKMSRPSTCLFFLRTQI